MSIHSQHTGLTLNSKSKTNGTWQRTLNDAPGAAGQTLDTAGQMLDTAGHRHRREGTGETLQELYTPHGTFFYSLLLLMHMFVPWNVDFTLFWSCQNDTLVKLCITLHHSYTAIWHVWSDISGVTCLEWHTLCVRSVDIQNPLCAFHTFTVVSLDAEITAKEQVKTVTNIVFTIENKRWQETAHRVGTALGRHQGLFDLSCDTFTHNSYIVSWQLSIPGCVTKQFSPVCHKNNHIATVFFWIIMEFLYESTIFTESCLLWHNALFSNVLENHSCLLFLGWKQGSQLPEHSLMPGYVLVTSVSVPTTDCLEKLSAQNTACRFQLSGFNHSNINIYY